MQRVGLITECRLISTVCALVCVIFVIAGCGSNGSAKTQGGTSVRSLSPIATTPGNSPAASPTFSSSVEHVLTTAKACADFNAIDAALRAALNAAPPGPGSTEPSSEWKKPLQHYGNELESWSLSLEHAATPNTSLAGGFHGLGLFVLEVAMGHTEVRDATLDDITHLEPECP